VYKKITQEWPITNVSFHRNRAPGIWKIIGLLLGHNFVLKLEDPSFLVNIFRIFEMDHSIAVWSIGTEEEAGLKEELLDQSLVPGGSNTKLWGNLLHFASSLFWLHLLEDVGYDEPFLFLHCGEKAPPALQRIITDNNLEPYVEYAVTH